MIRQRKGVEHFDEVDELGGSKDVTDSKIQRTPEFLSHIYADGWANVT